MQCGPHRFRRPHRRLCDTFKRIIRASEPRRCVASASDLGGLKMYPTNPATAFAMATIMPIAFTLAVVVCTYRAMRIM